MIITVELKNYSDVISNTCVTKPFLIQSRLVNNGSHSHDTYYVKT